MSTKVDGVWIYPSGGIVYDTFFRHQLWDVVKAVRDLSRGQRVAVSIDDMHAVLSLVELTKPREVAR